MKMKFLAALVFWGGITISAVAVANCVTNVIVNRDGTHTVCTICCTNGYCNTVCN